jgi:hypothetical protein
VVPLMVKALVDEMVLANTVVNVPPRRIYCLLV